MRLSLDLSERMSGSEEETRQLIGVIKKEPQLMLKIIGATEEREADFARVCSRPGKAYPRTIPWSAWPLCCMGNIARQASADYFSEGNTRPYRDLLLENIAEPAGSCRPAMSRPASPSADIPVTLPEGAQ